jgi:hypothetical protein
MDAPVLTPSVMLELIGLLTIWLIGLLGGLCVLGLVPYGCLVWCQCPRPSASFRVRAIGVRSPAHASPTAIEGAIRRLDRTEPFDPAETKDGAG